MKTRVLISMAALLVLLATAVYAADITGKWVAQVPGRDGGTREQVFNLKADGATLTGTIGGPQGDTPITEGKVDGNNISFAVVREMGGNTVKMLYKGVVAGNEIKFTTQREGSDRTREFTAKKAN